MWLLNFFRFLFVRKKTEECPNGLIPSPTDFRDVDYGSVYEEIPLLPKVYRIPYKLRISHQYKKPQN